MSPTITTKTTNAARSARTSSSTSSRPDPPVAFGTTIPPRPSVNPRNTPVPFSPHATYPTLQDLSNNRRQTVFSVRDEQSPSRHSREPSDDFHDASDTGGIPSESHSTTPTPSMAPNGPYGPRSSGRVPGGEPPPDDPGDGPGDPGDDPPGGDDNDPGDDDVSDLDPLEATSRARARREKEEELANRKEFSNLIATSVSTALTGKTGAKTREPDVFTGADITKLRTFFLQLELFFRAKPSQYTEERDRITTAISYLGGAALGHFEPALLGELGPDPPCLESWVVFKRELENNFGPYDNSSAAEQDITRLSMADNQRAAKFFAILLA
jgi:hypothetical protein